jgi:hypothetical protein
VWGDLSSAVLPLAVLLNHQPEAEVTAPDPGRRLCELSAAELERANAPGVVLLLSLSRGERVALAGCPMDRW